MIFSSFCSRYSSQSVKVNHKQNSKHTLGCNYVQNIYGFPAFLHVPLWKRLFLLVQSVRTYWKGLEVQEGQQVQEVQGSRGFLQSHNLMGLDYPFLPLDQGSLENLVDHDLYMWQSGWLSDIFSQEVNVKPFTSILFYIIIKCIIYKSLTLFLKSLHLYMCYLNQNHRFLVDLVVLGVLEFLGHQGYQDYHWNLDRLGDLQPIRVEMINTGMLFSINYIVFWSGWSITLNRSAQITDICWRSWWSGFSLVSLDMKKKS